MKIDYQQAGPIALEPFEYRLKRSRLDFSLRESENPAESSGVAGHFYIAFTGDAFFP